jgi:signal transduction histidine kinase
MEHEQATFEREVRTMVMPRLERLTSELPADAGTARVVLAAMISDLDAVCGGATPPALADGLVAALRQLAATSPVPASSDVDLLWVPPHIERILWYVAAEAVANAVKHAGATSITIEAFDDSELVTLRVTDDGRGGAAFELGSGLSGLRSRVARAGGDLTIESPIGNGTTITAQVPRA